MEAVSSIHLLESSIIWVIYSTKVTQGFLQHSGRQDTHAEAVGDGAEELLQGRDCLRHAAARRVLQQRLLLAAEPEQQEHAHRQVEFLYNTKVKSKIRLR